MTGKPGRGTVKPNFFIVGAPKSGTTSLYQYLRQHPEVFMPDFKATHFLSKDLGRPVLITEDQYFGLFQPGSGKKCIGEASTDYMFSKSACERIKDMSPDAKIVFILRNPVDRIYSGHAQRLWRGWENIDDFEKALVAEDGGDQRRKRPSPGDKIGMLSYRESGKYAKYVRRYIETFGRDRVHVMIFEDFVGDTQSAFRNLCQFLEIRHDVPIRFERHNSSKTARVAKLSRLFLPTSSARYLGRHVPEPARRVFRLLVQALMRWNTRYEERPPMRPELRRRLEKEFAEDVAELSELLERDLTGYWFAVPTEHPATKP